MIEETLPIVNRLGLHARAAAKLVGTAAEFSSQITVSRQGRSANAKSIMGVMMLAAACGTEIDIQVEGEDEEEAFAAIRDLIADRFGESE